MDVVLQSDLPRTGGQAEARTLGLKIRHTRPVTGISFSPRVQRSGLEHWCHFICTLAFLKHLLSTPRDQLGPSFSQVLRRDS